MTVLKTHHAKANHFFSVFCLSLTVSATCFSRDTTDVETNIANQKTAMESGAIEHLPPSAWPQPDPEVYEIVIFGEELRSREQHTLWPEEIFNGGTDSASLLKTLPGTNVNSNGPLTGIAQYRGLYGDRVSVVMDGENVMSGGPNAMDTPLSYAPPLLLEYFAISRGIASVSQSQESMGGEMLASLDRGEFADSKEFEGRGSLSTRHHSIDSSEHHALKTIAANETHKVAVLASYDDGNDSESGDNQDDITGSSYQRQRYDLSYGWQNHNTRAEFSIGQMETDNSGTPALPMDINYIDSRMANAQASKIFDSAGNLNGITLNVRGGYRHVEHGMDNFSIRTNDNPMRHRENNVSALQVSWGANLQIPLNDHLITVGLDGTETSHDGIITNPNMSLFSVQNFSNADRDIYGLFAQWNTDSGPWRLEAGTRYNHVASDSDSVSANGMMPMMQMLTNTLAGNFNSGDRDKTFHNIDVVLKAERSFNDELSARLGLGRKTRAPSYQERFLWLPLEATGGLADGRTYIGNLDLDSEVSHEITLGLEWQRNAFYVDGEVFYRDVKDYIQGVTSTNPTANQLAMMMSGALPLQFENIDAKLYGFDAQYGYQLSDNWSLNGVLSLVRGRSKGDSSNRENDNLYRIPPLNHRLTLSWTRDNLDLHVESVLYDAQTRTAEFNNEADSSGYGLLNLRANYQLNQQMRVSFGIENVFDKYYRDHLAGYNRNGDSSIPVGDRLPGSGRNFYLGFNLSL